MQYPLITAAPERESRIKERLDERTIDKGVDIVETGATLRENGLTVLEEVCPLSARMVVNEVSMKMQNERINDIITRLRKYIDEKNA